MIAVVRGVVSVLCDVWDDCVVRECGGSVAKVDVGGEEWNVREKVGQRQRCSGQAGRRRSQQSARARKLLVL